MTATPNLVLTGFMGTGKSAVGRAAAAVLRATFVDTDTVIEQRHGPIPEIFATEGEATFRRYEAALAAELAASNGLVISTGGGMLLDAAVATLLGSTGRIFCLVASPETILARVEADGVGGRPLLDDDDPAARISELLAARSDAYAAFEQVDTDGRAVEDIVADVLARFTD